MTDRDEIIPEMEVYASDGVRLGSVDAVEGGRIRLNTTNLSAPAESGHDHFALVGEVTRVEGNRVHLARPAAEAMHPRPGPDAAYPNRGAIDPPADQRR